MHKFEGWRAPPGVSRRFRPAPVIVGERAPETVARVDSPSWSGERSHVSTRKSAACISNPGCRGLRLVVGPRVGSSLGDPTLVSYGPLVGSPAIATALRSAFAHPRPTAPGRNRGWGYGLWSAPIWATASGRPIRVIYGLWSGHRRAAAACCCRAATCDCYGPWSALASLGGLRPLVGPPTGYGLWSAHPWLLGS